MAVQLVIEFETLLELVDQLTPEEQRILLKRLQEKASEETLSSDEFRIVFDSLMAGRELGVSDDMDISDGR